MNFKLLIFSLIIILSPLKSENDEIYLNYVASLDYFNDTLQCFLVIKVKDLNTGEIREICTDANGLLGALHKEKNIGYQIRKQLKVLAFAKKNKKRSFEFKDKEALDLLGLDEYTIKDLNELESRVDFDSLAKQIQTAGEWQYSGESKESKLYAHLLFNKAILVGDNSCRGGTIYYVDRNNPKD
jgi:hypothetical protein